MATLPSNERRRFQSTGFGGDRCSDDPLPKWKKRIHEKMRRQSKQNRNELLRRLRSERNNNKQTSPNTKRKNAESLIVNFKNEVIQREIATYQQSDSSNKHSNGIPQEMPPEMSLSIAEMEKWLETELLSEIRSIEAEAIETEELQIRDKKLNTLVEYGLDTEFDQYSIDCPFCHKCDLSIELITKVGVFNCEMCGIQFQSSNPNLRFGKETEKDSAFARRLLKATKERITYVYNAHCTDKQCFDQLSFRVQSQSRTVEVCCGKCGFRDCI